jgi:hypothetical protein
MICRRPVEPRSSNGSDGQRRSKDAIIALPAPGVLKLDQQLIGFEPPTVEE